MRHAAIFLALLALSPAVSAEARGAVLFQQHCAACHQAKGEGTPGLAPRIAGTQGKHAGSEAGRAYLAQVLVDGMAGPIVVEGERFNGAMPGFSALGNEDIQALLGYVIGALNGDTSSPVDLAAIETARKRKLSPNEVRRLRGS
ncbi:MAG: cytochrome c [Betaproteobacteria bacterium]|nr:cytochrome c [Betaproteobacteria bacterium]